MTRKPVLHVLTGCTAVGKTEAALQWAERHGAEIVSCDSLLFYRGMDLGTAKPTRAELDRVPHHLVDVCEPADPMDIARYVDLARPVVDAITARRRPVLVTGGSGFYLKAFFSPVVDNVAVPADVRERVAAMDAGVALAELRRLNPAGLAGLDPANPRRVARALERCLASGRTIAELRESFAAQPGPYADFEVRLVELVRERDDLHERITRRVDQMLADGLVSEVQALLAQGLAANISAAAAIGYREVIACLAGKLDESMLAATIVRNTRALVKKQLTWFRTQLPDHPRVPAEAVDVATLFAG